MKEFKLDVNGIAIPIVNCETQIEFTKAVSSFRYSGGKLGVEAHEDEYVCNIYIIYKDGTCYYHNGVDKDEGKYKRTGIKSGIITDDNSAIVFGSFAINEYGNISIDESDIEEYGVYAGQYDVKEQEVQEAVEQTEVEETAETETAKPETAEVSKEVVDNRKEVNSTNFIQQLYDAEYSKTLTVQGGIERFLKIAKEFVKNKSTEMSLIVDTVAQVLHDKYKLDYGTIETLEIEAYNS